MNKGDLFTVHMDGELVTVCVLGFYQEEYSGEEMAILAVVQPGNMVHVPKCQLDVIFSKTKVLH